MKSLSRVCLFVTPWTVAYQAPPSRGFSRQKYWSGWPLPSPYTCICKSKQLYPSNFSFHKFEILIFILEFTTFQNPSLFKHLPFSKKRQECWTHSFHFTPSWYMFYCFPVFHFFSVEVFLNLTVYYCHWFYTINIYLQLLLFTTLFPIHSCTSNFPCRITFLLPEVYPSDFAFMRFCEWSILLVFVSLQRCYFAIFFPLIAFKFLTSPLNFDSFTIMCVGVNLSLFNWPTHFWMS